MAATTAMIRWALQNFIPDLSSPLGQPVKVTALPPDRIQVGAAEVSQLNVFMYRTTPNPGWRNAELPSRAGNGTRLSQPPLALDLHYLLSAYAKDDLHAEILLGHAMEVLHGMSMLTREAIREAFGSPAPSDISAALWQLVTTSGLADQEEVVKLALEPLSTDEISKLWAVLGEKYRPSAAYQATVVLIRPRGPARTALPVTQSAGLAVETLPWPLISSVAPSDVVWAVGTPLTLHGTGLLRPGAKVVFPGGFEQDAKGTAAKVDAVIPTGVQAGIVNVRIVHSITFTGERADVPRRSVTRRVAESNAVPVVLRPALGPITKVPPLVGGPPILRVAIDPKVGRDQEVKLLLNRTSPGEPAGYSIDAVIRRTTPPVDNVAFAVGTVTAATYLLRVRVDGAESLLTRGADGRFNGPTVTFP